MKVLSILLAVFFVSANAMAIDCHGTEPFWGATVTPDSVSLEGGIYEGAPLSIPVNSVGAAAGFTSDFLQTYSNNNGTVAVVMTNKCSDSMSDETFPNEVIIFTGTSTLYGCCGVGVIE